MVRSVLVLALVSSPALAAIYESPISIDDEDDLRALADRGDISDATLQTLLELYEDGVDLNQADREELYELPGLTYAEVDAIIAFRKAEGHVDDPAVLVASGALSPEQLVQIAPFLLVSEAKAMPVPLGGRYQLVGAYTAGDSQPPPFFFRGGLKGPLSLSGGIGLTGTRRRVSPPFYDPIRDSLTVAPAGYRIDVPKFFLRWKSSKLKAIAGTFRLGFAQRLVLDNTTRYTPDGVMPDDVFYVNRDLSGTCRLSTGELPIGLCTTMSRSTYITDDFKWRDPFRGVAFSAEDLELGETARASFHAFGSFQTRSIYQYEIYDRRYCDDPRNDDLDECKSPRVYVRMGDGTAPEPTLAYSTLPALFDEIAAGAHADLSPVPMFSLGVTGYGAVPLWHVPQLDLDFQEWSKYPFGGPFGAVGLDGRLTLNDWNLYLEVARSFDSTPGGGGGFGAVQRSVWAMKRRELEITGRFYDIRYANPYARPVSSPDEVDGQRARNEAGLRIKYTDRSLGDLQLRAWADFWVLPWDARALEGTIDASNTGYRAGTMNLRGLLRADYTGFRWFQPALWFDYRNKDLAVSGAGACYTSSDTRAPPLVDGEPVLCTGEMYRLAARLTFAPLSNKKLLQIQLTYMHDFISDYAYTELLDQDVRMTLDVRSQPIDWLLLRVRARYVNGDLFSRTRIEESLWTFAELTFLPLRQLHVTARYDNYWWTDLSASTARRIPNPEHRFRLELEGRF
jgi:hypothetical protein